MTAVPNRPDQYLTDNPIIRQFVADVREQVEREPDPFRRVEALRPAFQRLLAADGWLPEQFAVPDASSGMGGGIGQYLLFRAGDGSLSLFSLVVPSGASTPVHDHLAWGLIGLYRGEQHEDVYELIAADLDGGRAELELVESKPVRTGELYALLPPGGDIHRVTTTSEAPSVSIHLLGNDTGCVIRHRFEPDQQRVAPFRSGYSNQPCEDEPTAAQPS